MTSFFGDFDTTETVYIPFSTFSSDDPSASVTITNLANTDIHIHKDGSTTQRSSSAGVTISVDFDTITGNHLCSIDLSDNTDAGFYANGSQYQVRMEGTTVDGATINAWIGAFSIGRTLRPTTAGRTLDVTATGAAGIDWGNIENASTVVDLAGTDINLVDTCTTNTDMRGTDSALLASSAPTNFGDLSITATTGLVTLAGVTHTGATIPTVTDVTNRVTANTDQINGDATAASNLEASAETIVTATAQASSTTTVIETNLTEATNDHYNGRIVIFRTGALAGQATDITDYNGTSKALTVTALTEAPANGDTFVIV